MKGAKATTTSGLSWSTSINGTDEEIRRYFMGQSFDVGVYPEEKYERVVKVEILPDIRPHKKKPEEMIFMDRVRENELLFARKERKP